MSNVWQLFSHSVPFAAGPLAEQLKNTMGGTQAAEKRYIFLNESSSLILHSCPDQDCAFYSLIKGAQSTMNQTHSLRITVTHTICKTNIL